MWTKPMAPFSVEKGMSLDVGAVAKGLQQIVAKGGRVLCRYILSIGGNICTIGQPLDGYAKMGVIPDLNRWLMMFKSLDTLYVMIFLL